MKTREVPHDQWLILPFLSKSDCDWLLHICYSVHAQTEKCAVMLSHCLPLLNPSDIVQKWIIKIIREDESTAKYDNEDKKW